VSAEVAGIGILTTFERLRQYPGCTCHRGKVSEEDGQEKGIPMDEGAM